MVSCGANKNQAAIIFDVLKLFCSTVVDFAERCKIDTYHKTIELNYPLGVRYKALPAPLAAVADYPINQVNDVKDAANLTHAFAYDDRFIWAPTTWSTTTLTVQYLGGIEAQIYDAIFRQARVLADREDTAPENTATVVAGAGKVEDFSTQFRSGLAPDVKQMIFPFQVSGF